MKQINIHIDLQNPTGNFWIDNGIVVLHQLFGTATLPASHVLQTLVRKLVAPTGKKGIYYNPETQQLEEYDKVNWIFPANTFISVAGKPGEKVKVDGKKYPTQPPVFELDLKLRSRVEPCDLCGQLAPTTDAKMWMFPFLIAPDKFSNFYPLGHSYSSKGKRSSWRSFKLCPRCALAGLAALLGLLWRSVGRDALHFFLFHTDLETLAAFHQNVLSPLRLQEQSGGNVPVAFAGPYPHETLWGLLLELFYHVRDSEHLSPEGQQLLAAILGVTLEDHPTAPRPMTLYAVSGKPGQAFQMQKLQEITKLHILYHLYRGFLRIVQQFDPQTPARTLRWIFSQFKTVYQGKQETIWRDKIAWAILEFNDPLPFIEEFLFDIRAKETSPKPLAPKTTDVFSFYIKEIFKMSEQLQKILAGFGHSLGRAAAEHSEMGILYALRNAKNPETFLQVLNDIQFRLNITIPEALLNLDRSQRIENVPWIRIKTLLSIYAMNAFLYKGEKQPTTEE